MEELINIRYNDFDIEELDRRKWHVRGCSKPVSDNSIGQFHEKICDSFTEAVVKCIGDETESFDMWLDTSANCVRLVCESQDHKSEYDLRMLSVNGILGVQRAIIHNIMWIEPHWYIKLKRKWFKDAER